MFWKKKFFWISIFTACISGCAASAPDMAFESVPASSIGRETVRRTWHGSSFEMIYPKTGNLKVDAQIVQFIEEQYQTFKGRLSQNIQKRYRGRYEWMTASRDGTDVLFCGEITEGGGLPSYSCRTLMMRSRDGKRVGMDDILRFYHMDKAQWMRFVGEKLSKNYHADISKMDIRGEQILRISNGVRIYFDPCEVSSCAEGVQYIDILKE